MYICIPLTQYHVARLSVPRIYKFNIELGLRYTVETRTVASTAE